MMQWQMYMIESLQRMFLDASRISSICTGAVRMMCAPGVTVMMQWQMYMIESLQRMFLADCPGHQAPQSRFPGLETARTCPHMMCHIISATFSLYWCTVTQLCGMAFVPL